MRPKLPPAPPELPARLRCFDSAEWGADPDASEAELAAARGRQTAAWVDWCREHDADPVELLRQRINDRRRADGVKPFGYRDRHAP